jgi:hypothetical protein
VREIPVRVNLATRRRARKFGVSATLVLQKAVQTLLGVQVLPPKILLRTSSGEPTTLLVLVFIAIAPALLGEHSCTVDNNELKRQSVTKNLYINFSTLYLFNPLNCCLSVSALDDVLYKIHFCWR